MIPDTKKTQRADIVVVEFHDADKSGEFLSWEGASEHIVAQCHAVYPSWFFETPEDWTWQRRTEHMAELMEEVVLTHNIADNYWFIVYTKTIIETEDA